MRIGLITGIFPPDIGGPARYVPKVAEFLEARGHTVSVLCLSDDPARDRRASHGFPVTRIRRGLFLPLRMARTVAGICRVALSSDVLYVSGLGFESWLASLLTGVPMVHKIVGDYAWERARNLGLFRGTIDDYQRARKSLRLRLMDWTRFRPLKAAREVIVPSQYLRRILEGWGVDSRKIRVVYNAVEPGRISEKPERNPRRVATVCRLVPWKGVDGLMEAVARIPGLHLDIAGDGPLRASLEALAMRLGIAERVTFHGTVEEAEVSAILQRAGVFVLNSTYEGLPHVVLEAMREKVPVIATDVGGTSEVVKDGVTGILIPAGDVSALEGALRRLAADPELADRLVRAGTQSLVETFSYDAMLEGAESVLLRSAASA
jgi:glycosyltransferase involved in cell wall biosynthesis